MLQFHKFGGRKIKKIVNFLFLPSSRGLGFVFLFKIFILSEKLQKQLGLWFLTEALSKLDLQTVSTLACPLLISKRTRTGRHYKLRVLSELAKRVRKKNFCYSSQLHKHTTLLGQVSLSNEISRCEVLCINANLCLYKAGIQNQLLQRGGKTSSAI